MDLIRLRSQAGIFMTGDTYQKDCVLMNKKRKKSYILFSFFLSIFFTLLIIFVLSFRVPAGDLLFQVF